MSDNVYTPVDVSEMAPLCIVDADPPYLIVQIRPEDPTIARLEAKVDALRTATTLNDMALSIARLESLVGILIDRIDTLIETVQDRETSVADALAVNRLLGWGTDAD